MALVVKNLPVQKMQEIQIWPLGGEVLLEKEVATHSSILAWKIPWAEEPGGLQFMGSQRVHRTEDWAQLSQSIICITRKKHQIKLRPAH